MSDGEEDTPASPQAPDNAEKASEGKEKPRFTIQKVGGEPVLWHGPVGEGEPKARGNRAIRAYAVDSWRGRLNTINRRVQELMQDMHDMGLECELALLIHSIRKEHDVFMSDYLLKLPDAVLAAKQAMVVIMAEKAKMTAMEALRQACSFIFYINIVCNF